MSTDYKSTVFLPKTDFPMRAGLPEQEPRHLERWAEIDLFGRLRARSKGREKFILHDGPPYANGHLHIGHALNKILKDVVNRGQQMLGKDAHYVPGWDCHGLPIEWKIEEQYRADGKDKDAVPIVEFRRECRDFAEKWIDIQRIEFQRLGVVGDWESPYTTMSYAAEAQIVREIGKFLMNGSLYRGAKPVMWSVVEKTALAEAEIEYHDHKSNAVYALFPVVEASFQELDGAAIAIWTTTPWTIPGNRAICYNPELDYVVIEATEIADEGLDMAGDRFAVATDLLDEVLAAGKITGHRVLRAFKGDAIAGTKCWHPLHGQGYEFEVPLLPGDHVTVDQGTGFVHTAPGHGAEDYEIGVRYGLEIPYTVGDDGTFYDHVPLFAGKHVYKVDGDIAAALRDTGALLASGTLVHSYPHSWRSKAPLIFRNTPQWFISMETNELRRTALDAIKQTRWVPAAGENRIAAMIETRPDWCISRQRAWGVPIAVFFDKESGEPLRDQNVVDRVAAAFEDEGADAWFRGDPERFLGNDYPADRFEQVMDIVDVWFDSGSTHAFVLENKTLPSWENLEWPASLYLEGSDQHRGWFHSSLLESCGTRGRAPYDAVLTHGFVLDEQGRKMSKSLGNVVAPQKVVDQSGADILRLWVVASDYSEDLRIGPEILKHQVDMYRRLRNTLRYILGNLAGFSPSERLPHSELPELERYVLHRIFELDAALRRSCDGFEFHGFYTALHNFCAVGLSAFYFDIRKDSLYCDRPDDPRRRAARTILDILFDHLTAWLAPVLCFTAEEAWLKRFGDDAEAADSVHLRVFPDVPDSWRDDALAAKWNKIRALRRVVTGALEVERAEKRIGSSLQAAPLVYAPADHIDALAGVDLAEIAITSAAHLESGAGPDDAFRLDDVPGVAVVPARAEGDRCGRCWRVLPEVGNGTRADDLCHRCDDAVRVIDARQAS
ncbi:MAG: isoleucine--tRNA ligase [Alphaproteobacteria bacterium]|nr:isoleucine--tRNA ligase [Alphaproteobacteria bacterium]